MANVIKRRIAPAPASGYAAFYYEWKNLTTDKTYGGKHNGFVDDGYNHSSKDPDMVDDFQNENHEWEYSVLYYGSESEITNKEREILMLNDAKNNPKWYNRHNGSTSYDVCKNDQIKFICDSLKNNKWLQSFELDRTDIERLLGNPIQVRTNSSDPKFTTHIKTLIDDKGDTSNTKPLVLFEDKNGNKTLINGNTTGRATLDSKHGMKLKYQVIPYEYVKNFSKNDFRALGLALNPKDKNPTNPTNIPDAVVYIIEAYRNEKRPVRDVSNVTYLREILNFSSTQTIEAFKEAEAQIKCGSATITTPLIRYAQKSNKFKLKNKIKNLESKLPNTKVFSYSSSMIRYGDILKEFMINDKRSRRSKDRFTNVILLIHFSSYLDINNWHNGRSKIDYETMTSVCSKYGLSFSDFEYMPKY